jgi:hypothetical protein
MVRTIHEGDKVIIGMTRKSNFLSNTRVLATVLHTPCDTGDWWHFNSGEQVFALNPCSSELVGIMRLEDDDVLLSQDT